MATKKTKKTKEKTYIVYVTDVRIVPVRIEAHSEEHALKLILEGEGEYDYDKA